MKQEATARAHRRAAELKPVHITSDDGQVDVTEITINGPRKDEVTWFAHGAAGATIVFSSSDGSPFEEIVFTVPAAGSVSSGPATARAVAGKPYKYTVVGRKGANDPVVIIQY